MAVDEALTQLFRDAAGDLSGLSEKPMMGGADRTKAGDGRFMFRVGKANEAEALSRDGATIMEQGGRCMGGLIFVPAEVCEVGSLRDWVTLALRLNTSG